MESLSQFLEQDHIHCDALFRLVSDSVCLGRWPQAKREMASFQHAMERHFLIEERIVFPAFEAALGHAIAPTLTLRTEHLRIRAVVQRLVNAVEAQDIPAFYNHADAFLLVMHQHSEKEEGVLYPRIERVLAHSCHDLVKAMRAFGVHDDSEDAA
jgi:hemerythrin-like domain-containing protein